MIERPILFNAPMVRALRDGCKTQTRRLLKVPHENPLGKWEVLPWGGPNGGRTRDGKTLPYQNVIGHTRTGEIIACPYGQPGDRLWVRESWSSSDYRLQRGPYLKPDDFDVAEARELGHLIYAADGTPDFEGEQELIRWVPNIHMPRWASRINLEITNVRVERLQDISFADAAAEGLHYSSERLDRWSADGSKWHGTPQQAFRALWEQINGPGSWDANPWVWAISFTRLQAAATQPESATC